MNKKTHLSVRPSMRLPVRLRFLPALLLLPTLAMHAQYVGKAGQGADKKPTLRATAVYEYTGSLAKPNSARLVPVVVWDGERYQPGGLYLARPEPLAVAPGTQYVLEQSGVPAGLFDIGSAGQLNGSWVGLGHFRAETPKPAPKLTASKKMPVLSGGSGKGKVADSPSDSNSGPVLHRKGDSDAGSGSGNASSGSTSGSSSGTSSGNSSDDRPTLHRRDSDSTSAGSASSGSASSSSSSGSSDSDRPTLHRKDSDSSDSSSGSSSGSPSSTSSDPDRPTLHRKDTGSPDTASAPAADPDRPTLHRHADASATAASTTPDPDRPHLRYGEGPADESRVLPAELKELAPAGSATSGPAVVIGQVAAISDTEADDPHPFRYTWPSPTAQTDVGQAMHALALRALANAAQSSFGPLAKSDAAMKNAADSAQASFGPAAGKSSGPARKRASGSAQGNPQSNSGQDPLQDPQLTAWELSYGGGATYVYSAHTVAAGADRRYVTVIAQPDFYGKPQIVFAQTTRGAMLGQTPALHLIDAVDTDGDHRAELLFAEQRSEGPANAPTEANPGATGQQFAIYSVAGGKAKQVYASDPGTPQ